MINPKDRVGEITDILEEEFSEKVILKSNEKVLHTDDVMSLSLGLAFLVLTNERVIFIFQKLLGANKFVEIPLLQLKEVKLTKTRRFQQITIVKNYSIDLEYLEGGNSIKKLRFWKIKYFLSLFMPDNVQTEHLFSRIKQVIRG